MWVYCYTCMSFGLRNTGATFQRLMHIAIGHQLGRNAKAYVDDIMVKSREARTFIQDLEETFANLCQVGLRLNPEKCGTQTGSRTQLSSPRRVGKSACASISPPSTRPILKTLSLSRASTRSSTPPPSVIYRASWTPSWAITKSRWRCKMLRRHPF